MNRKAECAWRIWAMACVVLAYAAIPPDANAQEESINPGINKSFEDPDVETFIGRFERDGRAVYDKREEIMRFLDLEPGMDVADIGAGTGFFCYLFADSVSSKGTVYAVDIAQKFVDHVVESAADKGFKNIEGIVNAPTETGLAENSIDRAFMCDTYHHFEFPFRMLESIKKALKPGGMLIMVDFERIKGETREFVWNMVRAGKGHFTDEIKDAGFELIDDTSLTDEHYILRFKVRE